MPVQIYVRNPRWPADFYPTDNVTYESVEAAEEAANLMFLNGMLYPTETLALVEQAQNANGYRVVKNISSRSAS